MAIPDPRTRLPRILDCLLDDLSIHHEQQAVRRAVRISKCAGMAVILTIVGLLLAHAYGGYRRTARAQAAARDAGIPKNPVSATQAVTEVTKGIPEGIGPLTAKPTAELQPNGFADHPAEPECAADD